MTPGPARGAPKPGMPAVLWGWFRPAAPAEVMLTDSAQIAAGYRRWQSRVLFLTLFGYATFYFVRKNLGVAMPFMSRDLGVTKEELGMFLTLHGVIYGVSKFGNGFLADRSNARVFMAVALLASALLNVWFGLSFTVLMFGLLWMFNGWFQGMGFPPCARLIANWFHPARFATKFSIWNMSHNVGSIGIVLLCGFLLSGRFFAPNWRLCFLVPAGIALLMAGVLFFFLPDTPPSVGLPEFATSHAPPPDPQSYGDFKAFVWRQVFCNPYIWILSIANFFVYAMRFGVFDWGPTMLLEAKHLKIVDAAWMMAGFEAFGALGALLGGWVTDHVFGGRAARACIVYMALATLSILVLWKAQTHSKLVLTGLLCAAGFFIYGPQCLLAIACVKLATKRAAATAVGLTSIFGYASTTLSGWGLGFTVQHYGWDTGFAGLIICGIIGTVLFALAWPAKAQG